MISTLLIVLASGFTILFIKNKVRILERQFQNLTTEMVIEKEKISVLKTELAYLSRAERIRNLAEKYLALEPARMKQVLTSKNDKNLEKQPFAIVQLGKWRYKYSPNSYDARQTKLAQSN